MMRNRWWAGLLLLCSMPAWGADAWCAPRAGQAFNFVWSPDDPAQPHLGSIRISDAAGRTHQVLTGVERYHHDSEEFDLRDFNNDGCRDLAVISSVAAIGNETLVVYLYQPKTRRFFKHEGLSEIGGLDIDPRQRNCVTGFWKSGASDLGTSRHCWSKGKLVKKREYSVSPLVDEEGEVQCYQHITTTFNNGKKRTTTRCTKEF